MKSLLVAVSLCGIAAVHATEGGNPAHNAYIRRRDFVERQAPPPPPPPATPPPASSPAPSSVGSPPPPASSPPVSAPPPAPTNPTVDGNAIPPLEQITSGAPVASQLPMFTTYAAGATPPVSGAPPLPTIQIVPSSYPPLDRTPPIDSPQVQQWLTALNGKNIPNLSRTVDGSCPSDPAAAADASRCWWTCGGCTRQTDITVCPDKGTWGVTFDDGPSPFTPKLLNYLHSRDLRSTFYVVGSRVVSRPDMVQTEWMSGHEISIHTWSHTPLTTLTNEQIVAELGWTRKVIKDVIGVSPNTMRPPYGDIDDRVRAVSMAMGLTPVIWTGTGLSQFDTKDWRIAGGTANGTSSFAAWKSIMATEASLTTGFITLEHDLYQQSVDMAVGYILPDALTHNPPFKFRPVIECLNQPRENAYAETHQNATSAASTSATSTGASATRTTNGGQASTTSRSSTGGAQQTTSLTTYATVVLGLLSAVMASIV